MIGELSLFLKQMLRNPTHVGAVVPSGRYLARRMAEGLGPDAGNVVELGPGTGCITRAIIAAGVAPKNLTVLEMNPKFCTALAREFPGVRIENCMAQDLPVLGLHDVRTVVSSLPLLNMSEQIQLEIASSVFNVLRPGGRFVQFTYGPKPPIAASVVRDLGLSWKTRGKVWCNIPPAQVYVFQREADATPLPH